VRRPRVTASRTIPAPVIPPPTTRTSSGSSPLIAAKASVRLWWVNAEFDTATPREPPDGGSFRWSVLDRPAGGTNVQSQRTNVHAGTRGGGRGAHHQELPAQVAGSGRVDRCAAAAPAATPSCHAVRGTGPPRDRVQDHRDQQHDAGDHEPDGGI